jgi:hypothetical protein
MKKRAKKKNWKDIMTNGIVPTVEDYRKKGVSVNLRKIFYILVVKELIGNTEADYQTLSKKIVEARMNGVLPIDCIVDEIRDTYVINGYQDDNEFQSFDDYVEKAIESLTNAVDNYASSLPKHIGQGFYIEFWLEKAAIYGSVVGYLDTRLTQIKLDRGYDSFSALLEAVRRLRAVAINESDKKIIIKYLGDKDPSGDDMDRDLCKRILDINSKLNIDRFFGMESEDFDPKKILTDLTQDDETIQVLNNELANATREEDRNDILNKIRIRQSELIASNYRKFFPHLIPVRTKNEAEQLEPNLPLGHKLIYFERIAVTKQQIDTYNLPPKPVDKKTLDKIERDPRYQSHILKEGELIAVEVDALDALQPDVLKELVEKSIDDYYDSQIYKEQILDKYGTADYKRSINNDLISKVEDLLQELKDKRDNDDFQDEELE